MAIFGLFKKNKKNTAVKEEAVSKQDNISEEKSKKTDAQPVEKKNATVNAKSNSKTTENKSETVKNTAPKSTSQNNEATAPKKYEAPKSTKGVKKTDAAKPTEDVKKAAPAKKTDTPKAADSTKKSEAVKKTETAKQADKKVTETAKKTSNSKANETENKTQAIKSDTSKEYTGKFEINKSKDGKKFFFNLYASNKVGIATSQMYSSSQSAMNGVKSVIANAEKAPVEDQSLKKYETLPYPKWEIYVDNGGKYRFRLNASNGNCVCHSQGYTTKTACKNGIDSIIRSSKNAEIEKTYSSKKDED